MNHDGVVSKNSNFVDTMHYSKKSVQFTIVWIEYHYTP